MGRAEGSGSLTGISLAITTTEERKILLALLGGYPEIRFAAVTHRSPRGALHLALSAPGSTFEEKLRSDLEDVLDCDITILRYEDLISDPLARRDLLDSQLLFDHDNRWASLARSQEEVRSRAATVESQLADEAWDALQYLKRG